MPARLMQSTIAATLAASAISFAPAAHADRLGFSVAIGGPGYAVAFGNAPYWGRPAWPAYGYRSQHFRPQWRPVHAPPPAGYVVAGYVVSSYAPPGVYAPRAAHAPPVIYRRHYAHHPGVESYWDRRVDHDRD
ncbi:MAG TPA: hypothetical protein VLU54_14540 [Casimicrobiaceae bacterium]|nr:hypothetical protein [Casimicrobiaceae bacterium]